MDYKEVRVRERIKKNGGDTSGRELKSPKRADYGMRRSFTVLAVLAVIAAVLVAAVINHNNKKIFKNEAEPVPTPAAVQIPQGE